MNERTSALSGAAPGALACAIPRGRTHATAHSVTRALPALLLSVSLAGFSIAAEAKGCLKGAAAGAVAGHVAGHHAVIGAVGGCAVGHHLAAKKAEEEKARAQAQSAPVQPAPVQVPAKP